jgi:hypothetical protein
MTKIIIRFINGFNVGLQLSNEEPIALFIEDDDGEGIGLIGFFAGLNINVAFIQIKIGRIYLPIDDEIEEDL